MSRYMIFLYGAALGMFIEYLVAVEPDSEPCPEPECKCIPSEERNWYEYQDDPSVEMLVQARPGSG